MTKYIYLLVLLSILYLACQPSSRSRSRSMGIQGADTTLIKLRDFVDDWLGAPYSYGGMSKSGTDCSGFTLQVMLNVYNIRIPRQARDQYMNGQRVGKTRLKPGDLIFFKEVRGRGVDHVGIFLGEGKFAHATETGGVTVSDLYEDYYNTRYAGACRYEGQYR